MRKRMNVDIFFLGLSVVYTCSRVVLCHLPFCYPSIERNFFLKSMGGGGGVSGSKL